MATYTSIYEIGQEVGAYIVDGTCKIIGIFFAADVLAPRYELRTQHGYTIICMESELTEIEQQPQADSAT